MIVPLIAATLMHGCSSVDSLRVTPLRAQDAEHLQRDLAECEARADRGRARAAVLAKRALAAPAVGAVTGAALGVAVLAQPPSSKHQGDPRLLLLPVAGAAVGFTVGALVGPVVGLVGVSREQHAYLERYMRCMDERGYRVAPGDDT